MEKNFIVNFVEELKDRRETMPYELIARLRAELRELKRFLNLANKSRLSASMGKSVSNDKSIRDKLHCIINLLEHVDVLKERLDFVRDIEHKFYWRDEIAFLLKEDDDVIASVETECFSSKLTNVKFGSVSYNDIKDQISEKIMSGLNDRVNLVASLQLYSKNLGNVHKQIAVISMALDTLELLIDDLSHWFANIDFIIDYLSGKPPENIIDPVILLYHLSASNLTAEQVNFLFGRFMAYNSIQIESLEKNDRDSLRFFQYIASFYNNDGTFNKKMTIPDFGAFINFIKEGISCYKDIIVFIINSIKAMDLGVEIQNKYIKNLDELLKGGTNFDDSAFGRLFFEVKLSNIFGEGILSNSDGSNFSALLDEAVTYLSSVDNSCTVENVGHDANSTYLGCFIVDRVPGSDNLTVSFVDDRNDQGGAVGTSVEPDKGSVINLDDTSLVPVDMVQFDLSDYYRDGKIIKIPSDLVEFYAELELTQLGSVEKAKIKLLLVTEIRKEKMFKLFGEKTVKVYDTAVILCDKATDEDFLTLKSYLETIDEAIDSLVNSSSNSYEQAILDDISNLFDELDSICQKISNPSSEIKPKSLMELLVEQISTALKTLNLPEDGYSSIFEFAKSLDEKDGNYYNVLVRLIDLSSWLNILIECNGSAENIVLLGDVDEIEQDALKNIEKIRELLVDSCPDCKMVVEVDMQEETNSSNKYVFLLDDKREPYMVGDISAVDNTCREPIVKLISKINEQNESKFISVLGAAQQGFKAYYVKSGKVDVAFVEIDTGIYVLIGADVRGKGFAKFINRFKTHLEDIKRMSQIVKDPTQRDEFLKLHSDYFDLLNGDKTRGGGTNPNKRTLHQGNRATSSN